MTQKFTAEEVRAAAQTNDHPIPLRVRDMLTAYADTLSKPADSGRVVDALCQIKHSIQQARIIGNDWKRELALIENTVDAALAAQGQGEAVAWRIDTDDDVERVAKAAGWNNRSYMTPADYAIWCSRMREFVRLAAEHPAPPASPAGVPDGLLEHLREALRRVENGHSPRRIPANPGDVDLALSEAIAWLEGRPAPFWVKPAAAPSAPEGDGGAE